MSLINMLKYMLKWSSKGQRFGMNRLYFVKYCIRLTGTCITLYSVPYFPGVEATGLASTQPPPPPDEVRLKNEATYMWRKAQQKDSYGQEAEQE